MSRVGVTPEPAWSSATLNFREKETSTETQKKSDTRGSQVMLMIPSKYFFPVLVHRGKRFFLISLATV